MTPKNLLRLEKKFVSQGNLRIENSLSYLPPKNASGDLSLNFSLLPSLSSQKQLSSMTTRKTDKTERLQPTAKNNSVKYFDVFPSLNLNKQTQLKTETSAKEGVQVSEKFDLFPTRMQRVNLVEKLSQFKSALDSVSPAAIQSAGSTLAPLFALFNSLISDSSYFSSTMRTFSAVLHTCLFFSPSSCPTNLLSQIHATRNNSFKQIFFGGFGQAHPLSYFDLLLSVIQAYQKDTEYLESLLVDQKLETEKKEEIIRLLGKELEVKDTLLSGNHKGGQTTAENASLPEFKSKLDVFAYKNNFEFEGKLIKAAFMENYEQMLGLVEGYRTSEATLKKDLQEARTELLFLRTKYAESRKNHTKLQSLREELDGMSISLVEAWHRVDKAASQLEVSTKAAAEVGSFSQKAPVVHDVVEHPVQQQEPDEQTPRQPEANIPEVGAQQQTEASPRSAEINIAVEISYPDEDLSRVEDKSVSEGSPRQLLEEERRRLTELNTKTVDITDQCSSSVRKLSESISSAVRGLFERIDQITNSICKLDEVLYEQIQ